MNMLSLRPPTPKPVEAGDGLVLEEYVDMKDAVTADPIVGIESTTLTEHGPGARDQWRYLHRTA